MNESGFGRREVLDVQLAVEEACTNIVLYAYEGGEVSFMLQLRRKKTDYGSRSKTMVLPLIPQGIRLCHVPPIATLRTCGGWGID